MAKLGGQWGQSDASWDSGTVSDSVDYCAVGKLSACTYHPTPCRTKEGSRQGLQHTMDAGQSRGTGQIPRSRRQKRRSIRTYPKDDLVNNLKPILPEEVTELNACNQLQDAIAMQLTLKSIQSPRQRSRSNRDSERAVRAAVPGPHARQRMRD